MTGNTERMAVHMQNINRGKSSRHPQRQHDPVREQSRSMSGESIEGPRNKAGVNLPVQELIDALPFYVMLIDENHYILQANRAVLTHLGLEPKAIVGKYCPKAIHGLDEPYFGCPLEEAVEKGGTVVVREVLDPGTRRWVNSAVYPTDTLTATGKKIYVHMVTDITERKLAEEQVRASRERLRIISAHLESVREEERNRIARDLHDETSQVLASLNAYLEAAVGMLPQGTSNTKTTLRKAQSLSVKIMDALHKLIFDLHPPLLDDLGLVAAVNSVLESEFEAAGVRTDFKTHGEVRRLGRQLETTIFRVIQEALNNVSKHANARNASVSLDFGKDTIRVNIRDDGRGFDAAKVTASKNGSRGFGLVSMKERIELLNGIFTVRSAPGSGTEISAEFPLKSEGIPWEK